jgi:hypothetical protein
MPGHSSDSRGIGDLEQSECLSLGEFHIFSSLAGINSRKDELGPGKEVRLDSETLESRFELGTYLVSSSAWQTD